MHVHTALIGDPSGDGHDKHTMITFVSNYPQDELWECYRLGSDMLGFDFVNTCCAEYEESTLTETVIEKLAAYGIVIKDYNYFKEGAPLEPINDETNLSTDLWFEIFMRIVALGSGAGGVPFMYIKYESTPMDIGGYGLFH